MLGITPINNFKEESMTSTLLIVQIILSIAITISVLLQKSSSIGLGAYSGSNESMFGAKGPMGFLAKITFTLAILFVINTLALGYLYTKNNNKSVVDTVKSVVPVSPEKVAPKTPVAPKAPVTQENEATPAVPVTPKEEKTTTPAPAVEEESTTPAVETVSQESTPVAPVADSAIETNEGNGTTTQQ